MRYIEPVYLNGKKRTKLIVMCVFFVIFVSFLVIFQIIMSIFSMRSRYLPITFFYCVCLNNVPPENEIKRYVSRGAGAVVFQEKLALAVFTLEAQAKSVSENLPERTCVVKVNTPKIKIDSLEKEQIKENESIYFKIIDCIKLVCDKTIALDKKDISEQDFHIQLNTLALALSKLNTTFSPLDSVLLSTISALNYLIFSTAHTDNLTPYISVVRSVTLNLLFSLQS